MGRNPELMANVSHSSMPNTPRPTNTHVQSQLSSEMLACGVSHPVFVSHVENGPHSFAIQLQDVVTTHLTKMMADLNSIEPMPITSPLNPGNICLGRYSPEDPLCRTIVLSVAGDKITLNFVDYGNNETVHYSQVFMIPPEFLSYKLMSHRFALANIANVTFSELEKKAFKKLVHLEKKLVMKVMPMENPVRQYCELYLDGKNIKQLIKELVNTVALAAVAPVLKYSPVSTPMMGSQEKVFVSYVLNPGRFFVQLDKHNYQLKQIMALLTRHCQTAPLMPRQSLKVNEPCCAMYEDNTWYRAEILSVAADKAIINFVDYGNQEEIEFSNLRVISPELVNSLKAQAINCCLQGYETRMEVDDEIANRFEELILEKKLMMHVVGTVDSDVLLVQLLDDRLQDISSQLEPVAQPVVASSAHAHVNHTPAPANDGWEETAASHSRDDRFSEGRGPSDDNKKSWRSREDGDSGSRYNKEGSSNRWNDNAKPRYNKDGDEKPWEKRDSRFNDNKGGRFNRDEESGGSNRFNKDEDSGGRYNRDGGSGGRYNNRDDGNRFGDKSGEERQSRFGGGGRFNDGNREGGGRFSRDNEDKPFKKRDDDFGSGGGGYRGNKDRGDGNWRDRENSGGWKDSSSNHSGEGKQNDGFKRGGFNRDGPSGERSSFKKPWERGTGDNNYQRSAPRSKSPKPDTVGGMPQTTAKVGVSEDAQVVFTTSPVEFYVQLQSSYDQLTQLMERIATACESGEVPDLSNAQEKAGCLAKYSEDNTWYRAVIEEKSYDSAKVLFVDYGNQESVTFDKIKELPEDMMSLPVQAIKCRLLGVPESAQTEAFSAMVDSKNLRTQFVAKDFTSKCFQVVLVDEETATNVNIAMGANEEEISSAASKMGLTTLSPLQYPTNSQLPVQITWFVSPSQFYLQPLATHAEFRAMMQDMQNVVRTGTVLQNNTLNVGDFVIARFKMDKVLYRARVKETGYVPSVVYVDYGNVEAVDSGSVWEMETRYATLPIQALGCCLAGVQPKGEAWPKDADKHFEAETLECTIIKEVEGETQYAVKLEKSGEDLSQKLIEAGIAEPGADAPGAATELDTVMLVGQVLPVTIVKIDADYTFYVLPTAEDPELLSLEVTAGEGVKCILSQVKEDATEELQNEFKLLAPSTLVLILVEDVLPDRLEVVLYDKEGHLLNVQNCEIENVSKISPLPVLNTHQKVFIVHADEDGIFLQKSSYADNVAEILQRLFDHYEQVESSDQMWAVGDFCCAKSVNDEQWYRAFILEFPDEETAQVKYIDYGNNEIVSRTNLRLLDPSFYTPHALALKVSLHVTWNVGLENLLELAGETEYNAVILRGTSGWVAELVDDSGQSLTEKVVELGFATELENSPFKRVVEGGRFVEGSDIPVSVSFVDSPLQLWIFVGNDIEQIEALQDRLQETAPKLPSLIKPKGVFAAKFTDGLWYRAIQLENSTVRFIDYGNSDSVDLNDIKFLSADFVEPAEGYAVKVELPVVDFKDGATQRLDQLLISHEIDTEEVIVAHILSVKESSIVADIIKGGKSVVDILVEEGLATRLQNVMSGFVSQLNSLSDFFIQEVGCEESLESMSNALLTTESFEPLTEVNEGDVVAALYSEDGLWYRAKVNEKSGEGIKVVFIDYGNSAMVSELKNLPNDLAVLPALSKHCALKLPSGVSEWSEAANQMFRDISADGCTQFDIKVLNQESPATVILCLNGKCITDELEGLCEVKETQLDAAVSVNHPVDLMGYDKIVYVSHANGVNDFYIQLEGAETELVVISENLSDTSSFEKIEKVTEDDQGKIIGAFFADDETWYRAKILSITEEGVEVLFVDYGNSAVSSQFVKLPENLERKPLVALHCSLDSVNHEDLSEGANDYFVSLIGEGTVPFEMKIIKDGDPTIVSLLLEEKIVELEILTLFGTQEEKFTTEKVQESENRIGQIDDSKITKSVFLIQVNSPSDFYLHTSEGTQLLGEICEKLNLAESYTSIEASEISTGNIVAAQIDDDDLWYRSKILDHSENETKVLFIDYGNTAKVAKVKNLPEELVNIPPLAMHCSLYSPENTEWSLSACETFNKLANDDNVSFDLEVLSKVEPYIVVLYVNGESVADRLISTTDSVREKTLDEESLASSSVDTEVKNTDVIVQNPTEDEKEIGIVSSSTEDSANLNMNSIKENDEIKEHMAALLLNSVESNIDERLKRDMQEITNDLVSTAVEAAKNSPNPQIDEKFEKAVQNTSLDSKVEKSTEKETVHKTSENHNGSVEEDETTSNENLPETQSITNKSETSQEKILKKQDGSVDSSGDSFGNGSPPTPRRSNIDEHIVPGCISSIAFEDSTDKS